MFEFFMKERFQKDYENICFIRMFQSSIIYVLQLWMTKCGSEQDFWVIFTFFYSTTTAVLPLDIFFNPSNKMLGAE